MEEPPQLSPEFRTAMKEWTELKKVISTAQKDVKSLKNREKDLNLFIKGYMKSQKIDQCNLKKGKVKFSVKESKKGINKDTMKAGLLTFFDGDEQRTSAALEAIENARETRELQSLRVTGLNDRTE